MRTATHGLAPRLYVFRMRYGSEARLADRGLVLWEEPAIRLTNVGTPMFVVPNIHHLPQWAGLDTQFHDYYWAEQIAQRMPTTFRREIVCVVRPGQDDLSAEGL